MARMPQIPGIEYGGQPARPERADLPPIAGGELGHAADVLNRTGDEAARYVEEQQRELDKAQAARQKILDTVTATKMGSDFDETLRNISGGLQEQYADAPEKIHDEFRSQARKAADDLLATVPPDSSAVGLDLARRTGRSVEQALRSNDDWVKRRQSQIAKNNTIRLENNVTRGAEDVASSVGLGSYAAKWHKDLDPLYDKLTKDSEKAKIKLDEEIARSWVTAAGARDPVGTMKALDAKKGFLVDNLTAEDRGRLRRQVEASFDGMGKFKQMRVLKEGIDSVRQNYDLFRAGELTAGAVYSQAKAVAQKKMAVTLDPNIPTEDRKAQLEYLDKQLDTLQALDEANRKQNGFDAHDKEGIAAELLQKYDALFGKAKKGSDKGAVGKDLADVLDLQYKLAVARASGSITPATFGTISKALDLALPKSLAKEEGNTGRFWGYWPWRAPRETGNKALNEWLGDEKKYSSLGKLTLEQKSSARLYYMEQLNDAQEKGAVIDDKATIEMARRAAYYAAGKHLPAGGR